MERPLLAALVIVLAVQAWDVFVVFAAPLLRFRAATLWTLAALFPVQVVVIYRCLLVMRRPSETRAARALYWVAACTMGIAWVLPAPVTSFVRHLLVARP
jgi:hypothetical protein